MKSILLIGLGRFGRHIARKLDELNHQIMAVDINEKRVEAALPYVTEAQIGDGTDEEFVSSLGVRNFDLCIVAIGDNFQSSLETTSLLRNGADEVVYPERQLAEWAAVRYSSDHILDYIELNEDYAIFEVAIPEEWYGQTIGQLNVRNKHNINIMALKHNGKLQMDITSNTFLPANDTMLILGRIKDIQKCFHIQ